MRRRHPVEAAAMNQYAGGPRSRRWPGRRPMPGIGNDTALHTEQFAAGCGEFACHLARMAPALSLDSARDAWLWTKVCGRGCLWMAGEDCRGLRVWVSQDCGEDGGGVGEVGEHGVGAGFSECGGG